MDPRLVDYDRVKPRGTGEQGIVYDGPEAAPVSNIQAKPNGEGVLLMIADGKLRPMTEAEAASMMVPYRGESKKGEAKQ